jgi:Protein of unknown function (DUF1153)
MIINKQVPTTATPVFRGPCGTMLNHSHLPPASGKRWTAERRAIIVCSVQQGALSVGAALDRYCMDISELETWCKAYYQNGLTGLKNKSMHAHLS